MQEPETNPATPKGWELRIKAYAEAERDNGERSEQSTEGMRHRVSKGFPGSKPPLGYVPARIIGGARNNQGKLVDLKVARPDTKIANSETKQTVADLVKVAFEMLSCGMYTQEFVRQHVSKLGLRTKKGHEVKDSSFQKTLRNPFYMGLVSAKKAASRKNRNAKNFEVPDWTVEAKGEHPPLVSEETFYTVQAVLDGRRKTTAPRGANPEFPLTGTVRCPSCKSNLRSYTVTKKSEKQYHFYDCQNAKCEKRFKGKAREMEARYIDLLEEQKPSKEFLHLFNSVIVATWSAQQETAAQLAKTAARTLDSLETRKKRIRVLIETGTYTSQEYLESKAEIEKEVVMAKSTILQANKEAIGIDSLVEYTVVLLNNTVSLWENSKAEDRDLINKALFPDGIYYENGTYRTGEVEDFKALTAAAFASLQDGSANGNRTRI